MKNYHRLATNEDNIANRSYDGKIKEVNNGVGEKDHSGKEKQADAEERNLLQTFSVILKVAEIIVKTKRN